MTINLTLGPSKKKNPHEIQIHKALTYFLADTNTETQYNLFTHTHTKLLMKQYELAG